MDVPPHFPGSRPLSARSGSPGAKAISLQQCGRGLVWSDEGEFAEGKQFGRDVLFGTELNQ